MQDGGTSDDRTSGPTDDAGGGDAAGTGGGGNEGDEPSRVQRPSNDVDTEGERRDHEGNRAGGPTGEGFGGSVEADPGAGAGPEGTGRSESSGSSEGAAAIPDSTEAAELPAADRAASPTGPPPEPPELAPLAATHERPSATVALPTPGPGRGQPEGGDPVTGPTAERAAVTAAQDPVQSAGTSSVVWLLAALVLASFAAIGAAGAWRGWLTTPAPAAIAGGARRPNTAPARPGHGFSAAPTAPVGPATSARPTAPATEATTTGPAPTGVLAELVQAIATAASVDPKVLHGVATGVQQRLERTREVARSAGSDAEHEATTAAACLALMPAASLALLVVSGGPSSPLGWVAALAATGLTVAGIRWTSSLAASDSWLRRRLERKLRAEQRWVERVTLVMAAAEFHARAGRTGAAALHAAFPADPDDPLRRTLARADDLVADPRTHERLLASMAVQVLHEPDPRIARQRIAGTSETLHQLHRTFLERWGLHVVSVRALGPALLCFVPASALLLAALLR